MSLLYKCTVLAFIPFSGSQKTESNCCSRKVVSGVGGDLDGVFDLVSDNGIVEDVCLDDCVYSKKGDDDEEKRYCFKNDPIRSDIDI